MTQEDKELLLKDLCARLPYWVQCEIGGLQYGPYTFTGNDVEDLIAGRTFIPYLRPMSSMTEKELTKLGELEAYKVLPSVRITMITDFFNEHHIDYRELIRMGLALEAPEGMYKTE